MRTPEEMVRLFRAGVLQPGSATREEADALWAYYVRERRKAWFFRTLAVVFVLAAVTLVVVVAFS